MSCFEQQGLDVSYCGYPPFVQVPGDRSLSARSGRSQCTFQNTLEFLSTYSELSQMRHHVRCICQLRIDCGDKANDFEGRQRLARYMIRCPFALEKMRYDEKSGMVVYRSKLHATLKRNCQLMQAFRFPVPFCDFHWLR